MPPKRQKLLLIRVPLEYKPPVHTPSFPPMPRLYMELLENKAKVKAVLKNKEFVSKDKADSLPSIETASIAPSPLFQIKEEDEPKIEVKKSTKKPLQLLDLSSVPEKKEPIIEPTIIDQTPVIEKKLTDAEKILSKYKEREEAREETTKVKEKPPAIIEEFEKPQKSKLFSQATLDDILSGKKAVKVPDLEIESAAPVKSQEPFQTKIPPSIEAIKKNLVTPQDVNQVKNIDVGDDPEITRKREILFKFKILRRTYKEAVIPEYNEYNDLKTLEREYDSVLRQLSLDSSVANLNKYLTIAFGVFEYIVIHFFKIEDIKGFTQQQMLGMNQYERILYEIGEKSYLNPSTRFGPEMRLLGLVFLNGVIFIGTKMLFKSTGQSIMNTLGINTGGTATGNNSASFNAGLASNNGKKKMAPPNIDLNTIGNKKAS